MADSIKVKLSYEDLVKTGADYLLVSGEQNLEVKNDYVKFEKQYEEKGMSIYKIVYL